MIPRKNYKFSIQTTAGRKWRVLVTRSPVAMHATIVCRWTMFAISTIFRVNTIYCNTIQYRLHRALGERNSFDGVLGDGRAVAHSRISHVINLPVFMCAVSFHYKGYLISLSLLLAHVNCVRTRSRFVCPIFSVETNKSKI